MHRRPFEAIAIDLRVPEDRGDAGRQQILERWTVLDGHCGQEVTNLCPHRRGGHRVLRQLRGQVRMIAEPAATRFEMRIDVNDGHVALPFVLRVKCSLIRTVLL